MTMYRSTSFLFRPGLPGSDGFGPGPSPKARRPEAAFRGPARPEPDFLKSYSIENFGLGLKARRPEAIFLSPARPEPDFFQPDPSLLPGALAGRHLAAATLPAVALGTNTRQVLE